MKIRDTPFGVFATAYGLYLLPFIYLLLPPGGAPAPALPWNCSPWDGLRSLICLEVLLGALYASLRLVIDFLHWKQATKDPWQHKDDLLRMAYLNVSLCFLGRVHGRMAGVFPLLLVYFTAFYTVLFEMVRYVNLHISMDVVGNPRGLGICIAALVVILGVLTSHLSLAFQQGTDFALAYVGWVSLGLLLHALASALPGGKLHLHHWYWAFLASHYPIFDCLLSSLAQAAFMGIYIHGAACFGLEAVYHA
mmetsp:Transcript_62220/g.136241  ORF Transcript_62220/g.136241 Transcript_62220/m.136241 type:complete len:250 (+) Transcript_62220:53-802(+)